MSIRATLKTTEAIKRALSQSTWSTRSLLAKDMGSSTNVEITPEILNSLLDLSGLSKDISTDARIKLASGLKDQLRFLDALNDAKGLTIGLKRLVQDNSDKYLTYSDLMDEINSLKQDADKGEIDGCWNTVGQAKETEDGYFVVNEGLIKK